MVVIEICKDLKNAVHLQRLMVLLFKGKRKGKNVNKAEIYIRAAVMKTQ